jgi:hypothetical protein
MSREAVIVSTARTPLAKSWRGAFNLTHGATLGGHVVKSALERAQVDPAEIEDVIMGCALPEGATGSNIGRQSALRAGCPESVPGVTVSGVDRCAYARVAPLRDNHRVRTPCQQALRPLAMDLRGSTHLASSLYRDPLQMSRYHQTKRC